MTHWNPRYVVYAAAHGHAPESMMDADRARYPGGHMAGYLVWHGQQLRAFRAERPECFRGEWLADHAAFNRWLAEQSGTSRDSTDTAQGALAI